MTINFNIINIIGYDKAKLENTETLLNKVGRKIVDKVYTEDRYNQTKEF